MSGVFGPAGLRIVLPFGLAALALVLGFIALLKQRTYLDAKTLKPLQIDIPLFGKNMKMRTNYPALVFVFLAFGLVIYALRIEQSLGAGAAKDKSCPTEWDVEGRFTDPNVNDWNRTGSFDLYPSQPFWPPQPVDRNGHFRIRVTIDSNKTFEDAVEFIKYIHSEGEAIIYPSREYTVYEKRGEGSNLESATPHSRKYKALPLERFQGNNQ